jgi:hypothetical protein
VKQGFWKLGRQAEGWAGGDYNGYRTTVTSWLNFPSKEAAESHKKDPKYSYFSRPVFEKWDE